MHDVRQALPFQKQAQELLERARDDEAARSQLLEIYRRYLGSIASDQIGPQLAAKVAPSDVVQEVIVTAFSQFASFRSDNVEGFTAWLRTLLLNRLSDARRKFTDTQMRQLNREISIQDLDSRNFLEQLATGEAHDPAQLLARLDDKLRIETAVGQLPPHYQQVVRWRLEGIDNEQIATRLDLTAGGVRALWQRAIAKLREILAPDFTNDTP